MMLHVGDNDFVAWANVNSAKRLCNEVDPFRCAAREDDLFRFRGVQEFLHLDAGFLVLARGQLAQQMDGSMDIGVIVFVESVNSFHYPARLLGRRGIVEIYQGMAVDRARKNRKVVPYLFQIKER